MDAEHKGKFIGNRKIKRVTKIEEKTISGFTIIEVEYEDKIVEWISSLMFEKIVSEKPCNPSELREKRVSQVVQEILIIMRNWGVKIGELPYISILLNQSLDFNQKEALLELWSKWMPKPISPDDVDFVTIDRVLKTKRLTLNDIFKPKKQ